MSPSKSFRSRGKLKSFLEMKVITVKTAAVEMIMSVIAQQSLMHFHIFILLVLKKKKSHGQVSACTCAVPTDISSIFKKCFVSFANL